jgi:DNA mismatch endonuclease (patch repair protein)
MVDSITAERRSWNMSRIRSRDTAPERQLRSLLHRSGFRFRLHDQRLPGRPDIVLPKYGTAVFVHGCFWHRHEGCRNATTPSTRPEFWREKFEGNVRRDEASRAALEDAGWNVITVWECELKSNAEAVLSTLRRKLHGEG